MGQADGRFAEAGRDPRCGAGLDLIGDTADRDECLVEGWRRSAGNLDRNLQVANEDGERIHRLAHVTPGDGGPGEAVSRVV